MRRTTFKFHDESTSAGVKPANISNNDCVIKAIAIATNTPLIDVVYYFAMRKRMRICGGLFINDYKHYLHKRGWRFYEAKPPVDFNYYLLPRKNTIIEMDEHLTIIKDGKLHDTTDEWLKDPIVGIWLHKSSPTPSKRFVRKRPKR